MDGQRRRRRRAELVWPGAVPRRQQGLPHTGGQLVEITLNDCVEASRAQVEYSHKNHTHWYPLLRQAGILPESTPPTMLSATRRGQLSIAELVDAQEIRCRPVRDLFVDYLHERAPGLDYSTLVALVSKIVRLFWRDLEIHEPGINSLHLSDDVARRWKQRLSQVRHGRHHVGQPRQDLASNLMAVRAFYADLTHWALEDPSRWAVWVAPSPVTSRDLAGMGKQRQRAVARTHQRTRELSPVLLQLVARADAQKRSARALLAAAVAAGPGEVFESEDVTLRRLLPARDGGRPDVIFARAIDGSGPRINVTLLDDYAFWAWASIEVLRHTAMRIREMLELTHRSFIAYTLPGTSEVIPLLQVAPSKTDRERLLVVSPELSEALAAIIARVRGGNDHIPLVSRYDGSERLHSPALPFLCQRPSGARQQPFTSMFVKQLLDRVVKITTSPQWARAGSRPRRRQALARAAPTGQPHPRRPMPRRQLTTSRRQSATAGRAGLVARGGPLRGSARWDRCGLQPLLLLAFRSQLCVLRFQVEDHADAGKVQPGLEQITDAAQPIQIICAIAACPALGPLRLQQTTSLIQA
jgi:hypothetical protein